jgi:(2Fe-2S) ferredoxin
MGKRRKLIKQLRKRDLDDGTPSLVICVGKDCCDRAVSRAVLEDARLYAAETELAATDVQHALPSVRIVPVKCLDICKKGPIVATYPDKHFEKRATSEVARALIDELHTAER